MAFQISPGVLVQEKDISNVVPAVATTIGGIVGNFQWGPVQEIVSIDSENELVDTFGKPTTSVFLDHMVASSFLAYGSELLVVRALDDDTAKNAGSKGTAIIVKGEDDYESKSASALADVGPWVARFPGTLGNTLKVEMADKFSSTNTSIASIALDSTDTAGDRTTATVAISAPDLATSAGGVQATATATIAGGNVTAIVVTHPGFGYTGTPTVTLTVNGTGALTATATKSTKWTYADDFDSTPSTSDWATNNGAKDDELNIIVIDEDGEITGTAGTIIEKYEGVSKASDAKDDVNQSNYYVNKINNGSSWIRWAGHPTTGANWGTATTGGTTYDPMDASDAEQSRSLSGGVDDAPEPGDIQTGYDLFANDELVDISLVLNSNHGKTIAKYITDNICDVRKDCIVFISPERGSVVPGVVTVGAEASTITGINEVDSLTRSSFAVMDSGWKYMYCKYTDRYVYVPLNGDVAGTCVITDRTDDPWFSPAGFNRGVIKNAVKLAYSPRKADRDTLYKNGVNPVINSPGAGIVLFGDKTLLAKPSAFNRINVRRLFIVLEKAIATAAKFQLFEFNDAFTRAQFVALVEPFLRDVQGRRGIYDFRVVCDETNNTPQVIDSNEFRADIFIKPAKSINFITLTFIATRTGISFEELGA